MLELSRFIEEIDEQYLEFITPPLEQRVNPMLNADIFGDAPEPSTFRFKATFASGQETTTKVYTAKKIKTCS